MLRIDKVPYDDMPPELQQKPANRPAEPPHGRGVKKNVTMQKLAVVSALGTNFVFAVIAGAVIGWLLDSWLGTEPWLLLSLALAGLCGGLFRFFKEARSIVSEPTKTPGP